MKKPAMEVYKAGDTRTVMRIVSGKVRQFNTKQVMFFNRPHVVPAVEQIDDYGDWETVSIDYSAAIPLPTRWERFKAWWTGRDPLPVARLIDRSS